MTHPNIHYRYVNFGLKIIYKLDSSFLNRIKMLLLRNTNHTNTKLNERKIDYRIIGNNNIS